MLFVPGHVTPLNVYVSFSLRTYTVNPVICVSQRRPCEHGTTHVGIASVGHGFTRLFCLCSVRLPQFTSEYSEQDSCLLNDNVSTRASTLANRAKNNRSSAVLGGSFSEAGMVPLLEPAVDLVRRAPS